MRKRATRTTDPLDGKVDFARFGPGGGMRSPAPASQVAPPCWLCGKCRSSRAARCCCDAATPGRERLGRPRSARFGCPRCLERADASGSFQAPQPAPSDARRAPRLDPSGELRVAHVVMLAAPSSSQRTSAAQNFSLGPCDAPHVAQIAASAAPHSPQNRRMAGRFLIRPSACGSGVRTSSPSISASGRRPCMRARPRTREGERKLQQRF